MKYPYIVKYNGVYYPAGAEVPDGESDEFIKGGDAQKIIDVPAPAPDPVSDPSNATNADNDDPNVNVAPETNDDENTVGVPTQASGDNDDEEDEEDDEPNAQFIPKPKYSKTTIQRMSTAEIREVAHEVGIENAVNKTGTQLKAELIEALNL